MFCPTLECPSDVSLYWFYIISAVFMSAGFASIIALAGEIINKDTFKKSDDND